MKRKPWMAIAVQKHWLILTVVDPSPATVMLLCLCLSRTTVLSLDPLWSHTPDQQAGVWLLKCSWTREKTAGDFDYSNYSLNNYCPPFFWICCLPAIWTGSPLPLSFGWANSLQPPSGMSLTPWGLRHPLPAAFLHKCEPFGLCQGKSFKVWCLPSSRMYKICIQQHFPLPVPTP